MKYLKKFEAAKKKENQINLINLDDNSKIIKVNQDELDSLIENDFTIIFDDEEIIGYDSYNPNEWRYDSDEENDIKNFLKSYRSMIKIYAFGSENIIRVTKKELDVLRKEDFELLYDDEEIGHDINLPNEWRYDDDEEEEIKNWLKLYRILKDPELVNKTIKFNL